MDDLTELRTHIERFDVSTTTGKQLTFGAGSPLPSLVVFFTMTCSSCQEAAPIISEAFANMKEELQLIGIGREHSNEELDAWGKEYRVAYDLVADPERAIFSQFANLHVPRMYLIGTDGKVHYQDVNWHPFMLDEMKLCIEELIAATKSK